jgi:hypothetical protein
MVESCQFSFSKTLNESKNRRIDETQGQVAIAVKQFPDAAVILRLEVNDFKPALLAVSQEAHKRVRTETLAG